MNRQKKRFNKYLKNEQFRKLLEIGSNTLYGGACILGVNHRSKLTYEDIRESHEKIKLELIKEQWVKQIAGIRWQLKSKTDYDTFYRDYFQEPISLPEEENPYRQSPIVNAASEVQKLIFAERWKDAIYPQQRNRRWYI